MAKRSYHQYCGIAAALDLLGERWTLLIVRDLLLGPKRFTDLLEGLPGIGTGLLSQRLRELEDADVIEKTTLPPPAASTVYRLTPDGEELRPVLFSLSRWGIRRLGDPGPDQRIDPNLLGIALAARFDPDAAHDDGEYGLVVDGQPLHVRIGNRRIEVLAERSQQPRAVITTDSPTLIALNNGTQTMADALSDGSITVEGDTEAAVALSTVFGLR